MEEDNNNKKKRSTKQKNRNSAAYLKQREKANARKRKFLDKMTPEQRELKKAKDREYYQRKKAEKKTKTIDDMTEREKRQQRKKWKKNSQKYREKKKMLVNLLNDSPPNSGNEGGEDFRPILTSRAKLGRKTVKKDRSKAYRTIKKQREQISNMQRKIDSLRKKLSRKTKLIDKQLQSSVTSPNSKVNEMIRDCSVTPEVRKKLLFNEVLSSQLAENSNKLPKNSKEREVFQKCVSGQGFKKYRLSNMAKPFLPKFKNNRNILVSDRKAPTFIVNQDVREKIVEFYEKDDVSRMCPGKKDCLKGGKQKRLLLDTVKNLHPKFVAESGMQLSYTTLLREKPYWVIQPKSKDRETCLCARHENFQFKLEKLLRLKELDYTSIEKLIAEYSCDVTSYTCMFGTCLVCGSIEINAGSNEDTIEYFQWQTVKEDRVIKGVKKEIKLTKKVCVTSTVKELKLSLLQDIFDMKKHIFGINENHKEKRYVKDTLNDTELMMQIDFAENYMTKYGKEIQATHFGASKGQLSIHTGVFYCINIDLKLETVSFASISDNLDHQAHAIWGHMKPMLQKILSSRGNVQTIHIFSDGPTSQYRNRTNIYLMIRILMDFFPQITTATWTYSEPGHGKGPMDGVGGVLKKTADDFVLKGHDINKAKDFINVLKNSSVLLYEVAPEEIEAMKKLVPKNVDPVPGIMNVTKIIWNKSSDDVPIIKLFQHGKWLKNIKLNAFSNESREFNTIVPELSDKNTYVDGLLQSLTTNRPSIYDTVYSPSSSDGEDLQTISNKLHRKDEEQTNNDVGTSYDLNKENLHPNLISPNTFLLVNVPTQKKNTMYRYAAIANTTVEEDGEVKVTFLRHQSNSAKIFRVEDNDISYVAYDQICKVLPTPELQVKGNRVLYHFDEDVDIFEK